MTRSYSLFLSVLIFSGLCAFPATMFASPATVTTQPATAIGLTNATLNAQVNPGNEATAVYFEYTTDTNVYGAVIPNPSFEADTFTFPPGYIIHNTPITGWTASDGFGAGLQPSGGVFFADNGAIPDGSKVAFMQCNNSTNTLATTITGLTVGRTYRVTFRANRRSEYGNPNTSWSLNGGAFVPFTCSPAVGGTNPYHTNSATFTATNSTAALVLKNGASDDATAVLDAFTIASVPFSLRSGTTNLVAGGANVAVASLLTNLPAGTTYYFRAVASNASGVVTGTTQSFSTFGRPIVTTQAATSLTNNGATLNALVNPQNVAAIAYFEFGSNTNYADAPGSIPNPSFETDNFLVFPGYVSVNTAISGWTVSASSRIGLNPAGGSPFADNGAIPDGTKVAFIQSLNDTNTLSTTISNLAVGKTYRVSFRANCRTGSAPNGTWSVQDGPFVPFTAGPAVGGSNPYYTNSAVFVAYHTTAALALRNFTTGDSTVLVDAFTITQLPLLSYVTNVAATNVDLMVSQTLTNLRPASTYYFRAVATNSFLTVTGSSLSFTTVAIAPAVTTGMATDLRSTNAVLNGLVTPFGSATTAYFEFGTDTNYGRFTTTNTLAPEQSALPVTSLASALTPSTLYHFRLVASNVAGVTFGANQTFSTPRAPTAVSITNTADAGAGSLRQAILNSAPGDTISFAPALSGTTLTLTSGPLLLTNDLRISASNLANGIRLNGNGANRIFQVSSGVTVTLADLTLTNGTANFGAGIFNSGTLILDRCTLAKNVAAGANGNNGNNGNPPSAGTSGSDAQGGGIYNLGTLTLNQCTLSGNLAQGGNGGKGGNSTFSGFGGVNGGNGGHGGSAWGGAIYSTGVLTVNQSTLSGNAATAGTGGTGGFWSGSFGGSNGAAGTNGLALGGGIYQTNSVALFNSIVAGNTPDNLFGPVVATGNNLTNGDPRLAGLRFNEGPTPTLLPLSDSPAVDAGAATPFTTDQRGLPRSLGAAPDLGAVETIVIELSTQPASSLTNTAATLNGLVNPYGLTTSNFFQYGPTTNYGSTTATNALAPTTAPTPLSRVVTNLQPTTTYHCRLVVISAQGTVFGSNVTFTTTTGSSFQTPPTVPSITSGQATLNATVNPSGLSTTVYFEYGLTTSYGLSGPTNVLAATNAFLPVSSLLSNLLPGTLYHFRLVSVNSAGTSFGPDGTFTTQPLVPVVTTLSATDITATSATLQALVHPGNGLTVAYFRFVTETNYPEGAGSIPNPSFEADRFVTYPGYVVQNAAISGWTVSSNSFAGLNPFAGQYVFADNGRVPDGTNVAFLYNYNGYTTNTLSTTISNLTAGTVYEVTFRANRPTFDNAPNPAWSLQGGPFVGFSASTPVGGTNAYYTNSALFTATNTTAALVLRNTTTFNSGLLVDAFTVNRFFNPAFSGFSSTTNLAATNVNMPVSLPLTGLRPAMTYYVQIIANNSAGTATGNTVTFTTAPAAPTVTTLTASNVTATTATLNGLVTPNGSATSYYFEFGPTTNYGSFTATNVLPATNILFAVSNVLSGLQPFTAFHFRLVAVNGVNKTTGANQSFTTTTAPPTIVPLAATILGTNPANGLINVRIGATVYPNGSVTAGYFSYGQTTNYQVVAAGFFFNIPTNITATNLFLSDNFSAGSSYHWRVTATNGPGGGPSPDQVFSLGTLATSQLPGDSNGDGLISQAELETVYSHYVTNSPWLALTNVAGLGGSNVSFTLSNPLAGAYTVQYSTNLLNWFPLGPATPQYLFLDTNAPAQPQRYYRLVYP